VDIDSARTIIMAKSKRCSNITRKAIIVCAFIFIGLAAFVFSDLYLWELPIDKACEGQPVKLGRINDTTDIYFHIGNVAVPNLLEPIDSEEGVYRLQDRFNFWDTYVITAPVPRQVTTEGGTMLEIPWTLLPSSVVSTVSQLDSELAETLELWLKLKESPADWDFGRLERFEVSPKSVYAQKCSVRSLYAVNMFEFLDELGKDYQLNLTSAISTAIKEVLEYSGEFQERTLAVPALAAAEHVVDRELVVSYADSFKASLDGVSRAQGKIPSQVVFVVWHSLEGHPEFDSATGGLEQAAYAMIPLWSNRLQTAASVAIGLGLLTGLLLSHFTKRPISKGAISIMLMTILVVLPVILEHFWFNITVKIIPFTSHYSAEIGFIAGVATIIGYFIHRRGLVTLLKTNDHLAR